jgi:hypothetical protein
MMVVSLQAGTRDKDHKDLLIRCSACIRPAQTFPIKSQRQHVWHMGLPC